jgi:hypothetical protein
MNTKLMFALLTVLATGCSSTGFRQTGLRLDTSRTVCIIHDDLFLERYYPRVAAQIQSAGFVISTNAAQALTCKLVLHSGVTMRAHVSLWDGDSLLLSGEASNGGWGTMLANQAARDNVMEAAIAKFAMELRHATGKP